VSKLLSDCMWASEGDKAVAFSLLAALIHLRVIPEHLAEWCYGTLFLVCAIAEVPYVSICCAGLVDRSS
jgi:hypothetical protein